MHKFFYLFIYFFIPDTHYTFLVSTVWFKIMLQHRPYSQLISVKATTSQNCPCLRSIMYIAILQLALL